MLNLKLRGKLYQGEAAVVQTPDSRTTARIIIDREDPWSPEGLRRQVAALLQSAATLMEA